jgi:hypothetical protein
MMKINRRKLAHVVRKAVEIVQYAFALPVLYLVASLLPGDRIGFNVVGTIGMLVILAVIDAAVSVPLLIAAKRLEKDVLAPVPVRSEW